MNNLFSEIDIKLDYQKIVEEYENLKVNDLIVNNNNQIALQCKENSNKDIQLFESTGSLWLDWNNIDNSTGTPVKKKFDIKKIDKNNINNNIFFLESHGLKNLESVMKYDDDDMKSISCYVHVIDNNRFFLSSDLNGQIIINVSNNKRSYEELYRNVSETVFNKVADYFKGSYFEYVVDELNKITPIFRGRFMLSKPKTCLSWHNDFTTRIHIPIYTNGQCFMVIENSIVNLKFGKTYWVNTVKPHTAINASSNTRVHLVFCCDLN